MNKKYFYIIPGWEENAQLEPYMKLAELAKNKGYEVRGYDIDWKRMLSSQVFDVPKDSVIFGFSLGAILAWLISQEHSIDKLILASMTPHYSFSDPIIKDQLIELVGEGMVSDIVTNLQPATLAIEKIVLYGDREDESADVLVADTEHELTSNYISEIGKLI
jgi:hypothetical protein